MQYYKNILNNFNWIYSKNIMFIRSGFLLVNKQLIEKT